MTRRHVFTRKEWFGCFVLWGFFWGGLFFLHCSFFFFCKTCITEWHLRDGLRGEKFVDGTSTVRV